MALAARALLLAAVLASTAACGGSSSPASAPVPTGTLFSAPFTVRDALLVHPQTWKSAAPGSTALLFSDTPGLCAQITSGRTTAPGRLVILRLEQRDAAGAITALTPGTFTDAVEGAPSTRLLAVYGDAVDAACTFWKTSPPSTQEVVLTETGAKLGGSVSAVFANGDALGGTFEVSATCDEAAVDTYLNRNPPSCG